MSNRRRLRPPPTGYSYEKIARVIAGLDLTYAEKQQLLLQAAKADKKGKYHGPDPTVRELPEGIDSPEDVQHGTG